MIKKLLAGAALATTLVAAPASAAVVFTTTWEADQVPDGPAFGAWKTYNNPPSTSVAGWTPETQIELQNHAAGDPAATGGDVFAELDADFNSSMSRIIGPGTYTLSYLYSPRPRVGSGSNPIQVSLNGDEISYTTGSGLLSGSTAWYQVTTQRFTLTGPTTLRFAAQGTSDSLGGYIDNITLATVPEPTTWALFILGFGAIGYAMRRRSSKVRVAKASLNFA